MTHVLQQWLSQSVSIGLRYSYAGLEVSVSKRAMMTIMCYFHRLCLLTHRGRLEGLLTRQGFLQHVERLGRPNQSSNIASIFNAD